MPSVADVALHFFLQMAVIVAVYRLLWPLFRRLRQVQVVAIMVTGFVLGPSLLGAVSPELQDWLFPKKISVGGVSTTHPSLVVLYVVGQLGLIIYMFLVGMAFNTQIFARHVRHATVTSVAGIATPMLLGGLVGWLMVGRGGFFPDKIAPWQAALFVAAAVAITAFPMLAWIVYDSGLLHTRLGTMALACAAADDAAAWILLAAVVSSTKGTATGVVAAAVGGLAYLIFMVTAGRRALRRLGRWADTKIAGGQSLPSGVLVMVILVMLLGAWFTDLVGVYSVFGAFVAGAVMPRGQLSNMLRERLEPLTAYVLLPAFFVYSGLNTQLSLIFEPATLVMMIVILVVSFVGKGLSVTLAARFQGMDWREAGSLGALMNARGLMELILLNIGLNARLVGVKMYTIMAIMAIVTTFAASPLHHWIEGRRRAAGSLHFPATDDQLVVDSMVAPDGPTTVSAAARAEGGAPPDSVPTRSVAM